MNIIILTDLDILNNNEFELFDERYLHIKNILKKEIGDQIEIGYLNKGISRGKISNYTDKSVIIKLTKDFFKENENKINLDIICALPRPQTLKKILPLIATTGVKNLHLIKSSRVEKSFFYSPLVTQTKKIRKYLFEGLSQGKKTILPDVKVYTNFKEYFETEFEDLFSSNLNKTLKVIAHPDSKKSIFDVCEESKIDKIIVAVGPEGGWIPCELEYLETLGFQKIVISRSVLRVENAINAIIAQKELVEMIL